MKLEKKESNSKSALVVFSGGMDSTICLHWAIRKYKSVQAIFFNYGQRHSIEQESAKKIAKFNSIPLKIIDLSAFKEFGNNALVDAKLDITHTENNFPNTFVPGRNLIFLAYAASYAYTLGITELVTGVCQTDYSGYPDCRMNTILSLQKTLGLGLEYPIVIQCPLMYLTKAQSVNLAQRVDAFNSLAYSHTCYEGQFPPCQKCPACKLRSQGFYEAEVKDPLLGFVNG